ncbi:MAG: MFS transporter [bacterium]|nr:MFS transporter [bacterium]
MPTAPDTPRSDDEARRLARNPALLCVHQALMMSLFPMAIITVFQRDLLGLSVREIMIVQAAFGASLVVLEFPSGYLADRIGYRPTMILASATAIGGWAVYSAATGFASVIVGELLLGVSLSLVSGTSSAMLYESLDEQGQAETFARWFGRSRFWGQMGEGSAALAAGVLFVYSERLPFQLMVVVWILNLGVSFALVEPRYTRHRPERPVAHVIELIRYVARHERLRAIFAVAVTVGVATFVPVWLVQLYAQDAGVALSWLGPIWAAANYVVAIGSAVSDRTGRALGMEGVMLLCCGLLAVGYFGMGLTTAWWGFVFYFAFNLSRGLSAPLIAHAEQAAIPSGDRASLVSMRSLLFRAAFIGVGPAAGEAIDRYGQHVVLLGLGGLLVTGALAAWLPLLRTRGTGASPNARRIST